MCFDQVGMFSMGSPEEGAGRRGKSSWRGGVRTLGKSLSSYFAIQHGTTCDAKYRSVCNIHARDQCPNCRVRCNLLHFILRQGLDHPHLSRLGLAQQELIARLFTCFSFIYGHIALKELPAPSRWFAPT